MSAYWLLSFSLLSMFDVSDQVTMSDPIIGVDQTGTVSPVTTRHLLLSAVHVEVLAQEEGVGHLHLAMRGQARALIDKIVVLLLWLNVDQTVLRSRGRSSETFLQLVSPYFPIWIFIATRLTLASREMTVVDLLLRTGGERQL